MRILVTGSRTFADEQMVWDTLRGLDKPGGEITCIIEGGAKGADSFGATWAWANKRSHEQYNAEWDVYGKAAGAKRNQQMLVLGEPDRVIAFVDKPLGESRGTHDMVVRARKAGLPVMVVQT